VQYARRVVGRKTFGGQSTHIPIKVNHAGVIPIIFSLSILQFPITIAYFFPRSGYESFITKWLSPNGSPGIWIYVLFNIVLIIMFTYFYTNIVFKTEEIAKNLSQSGGSVPGIRPGKDTDKYLHGISNRLCLVSGLFLALVSTLPTLVSGFSTLNLTFGGTTLIILVGVALDTMQQIKNRTVMNTHYGFLK
jgi:preprotein translocase subunit SecY